MTKVSGFSKLTKAEKISWVCEHYLKSNRNAEQIIRQYLSDEAKLQKLHDEFAENTITNYFLPFGVAPNF